MGEVDGSQEMEVRSFEGASAEKEVVGEDGVVYVVAGEPWGVDVVEVVVEVEVEGEVRCEDGRDR